jgi:hypothetical protein
MDYKFLNKVINQIVSETKLEYDRGVFIKYPWTPFYGGIKKYLTNTPIRDDGLLIKHLKNVYGLTEDEVQYVQNEYRIELREKILSYI